MTGEDDLLVAAALARLGGVLRPEDLSEHQRQVLIEICRLHIDRRSEQLKAELDKGKERPS